MDTVDTERRLNAGVLRRRRSISSAGGQVLVRLLLKPLQFHLGVAFNVLMLLFLLNQAFLLGENRQLGFKCGEVVGVADVGLSKGTVISEDRAGGRWCHIQERRMLGWGFGRRCRRSGVLGD